MAQTFYPLAPAEVTPGTLSSWQDIDVSGNVPSGATGVLLHLTQTSGSGDMGLRKNGSTDNRTTLICVPSHCWAAIGVDANGIFEAYVGSTYTHIYLVGYTMSGVTFFTNAYDKTPGTGDVWTDIDCHVEAPNAIGLLWEIVGTSILYGFGLRENGSSDDRTAGTSEHCSFGFVIGCDASQICEGYNESSANSFFLVGYITDGASFNLNATDVSLGSTGSWLDLPALPVGTNMGFIEIISTPNGYNYGLRKNGETEGIYLPSNVHPCAFVECDVNRIIEGEIANTVIDFFVVGYAAAGNRITYDGQVGASSDDCVRGLSQDFLNLTSVNITVGADSSISSYQQGGGMRFTVVSIPQGATINTAYLRFKSTATEDGTTKTYIEGEDVDNAPTFADDKAAFDNRYSNHTTARVDWEVPAWTDGNNYNSPEIKDVIQEIVNRANWASGNSLVLFWEDFDDRSTHCDACYRIFRSYDGDTTYAPKLHVEYTVAAPSVAGSSMAAKMMAAGVL